MAKIERNESSKNIVCRKTEEEKNIKSLTEVFRFLRYTRLYVLEYSASRQQFVNEISAQTLMLFLPGVVSIIIYEP